MRAPAIGDRRHVHGTASGRNEASGPERCGRGNRPQTRCEVEKQKSVQSRRGAAGRPAFSVPHEGTDRHAPLQGKGKRRAVGAVRRGVPKAASGDPGAGVIGRTGASLLLRHRFALLPSAKRFLCAAAFDPPDRPPFSDKETEAQEGGVVSWRSHSAWLSQDLHPGLLAPPHILSLPRPVAGESWRPGSRMPSSPPTARSRPQGTVGQAAAVAVMSEHGVTFWVSCILPG